MAIPPFVFGRTQNAFGTPFASEPDRSNGFTSKDVQLAIEEALALAVANDRFVVFCAYNGNANNRTLEAFNGIDMVAAPIRTFTATKLLSVVIGATAASTGAIAFYDRNVSTTVPFYTLNYGGAAFAQASAPVLTPLASIPTNALIECRTITASVNKPHVFFFLSSSTV